MVLLGFVTIIVVFNLLFEIQLRVLVCTSEVGFHEKSDIINRTDQCGKDLSVKRREDSVLIKMRVTLANRKPKDFKSEVFISLPKDLTF